MVRMRPVPRVLLHVHLLAEVGASIPMPWDVPLPVMDASPAVLAAAAPKDFAMRLRRGSAAVWVEVFDPDLRLPRIRSAEESDEGGRVPGRTARHPVGIQADAQREGRLVRDADRRPVVLTAWCRAG